VARRHQEQGRDRHFQQRAGVEVNGRPSVKVLAALKKQAPLRMNLHVSLPEDFCFSLRKQKLCDMYFQLPDLAPPARPRRRDRNAGGHLGSMAAGRFFYLDSP
jgi:hypothetical protein